MTFHSCKMLAGAMAMAMAMCVSASAQAAIFYEIDRIDDNTLSITGSGTLDADLTSVEQLVFVGVSSQTGDGPALLTGDLGFGGFVFPSGGPFSSSDIVLLFGGAVDLPAGSGPEGTGGFSTTENDFTLAPIGTTGDVVAFIGFDVTVIGTYRVVPEPASLALLGFGGLIVLRPQRGRATTA